MNEVVPIWEARARALARCLDQDPAIVFIGHSTSAPFNPDDGIPARYPDRFLHPPISEFAVLGAAVGAATAGLRPCVFVGTSTFAYYGWPAIVNEAPHIRYVTGGATTAPVVIHVQCGARRAGGVQHEHTPQAMLQNQAGLVVYAPATPQSMYDVFCDALTGSDPVVIADHVVLGEVTGPLDERGVTSPAPVEILHEGSDGLIVASSLMSQRSLAAARRIAATEGASVAVANVTRLAPSPDSQIIDMASAHPFVLLVDESRGPGSPASYWLARVAEAVPEIRLRLLTSRPAPFPFSPTLLDEVVPTTDWIERVIRSCLHSKHAAAQ